jgi:predicted nucleic acid-binding protein
MKYYVDTCIWIDYWENRSDNLRPIGEFVANFLINSNLRKDKFIISDIVFDELRTKYSDDIINNILRVVNHVDIISINSKQAFEAKKLSRIFDIPFGDATHAVIARDNAALVVTRDKYFVLLCGIVQSRYPEELV